MRYRWSLDVVWMSILRWWRGPEFRPWVLRVERSATKRPCDWLQSHMVWPPRSRSNWYNSLDGKSGVAHIRSKWPANRVLNTDRLSMVTDGNYGGGDDVARLCSFAPRAGRSRRSQSLHRPLVWCRRLERRLEVSRGRTAEPVALVCIDPDLMAGDLYGGKPHVGGWRSCEPRRLRYSSWVIAGCSVARDPRASRYVANRPCADFTARWPAREHTRASQRAAYGQHALVTCLQGVPVRPGIRTTGPQAQGNRDVQLVGAAEPVHLMFSVANNQFLN